MVTPSVVTIGLQVKQFELVSVLQKTLIFQIDTNLHAYEAHTAERDKNRQKDVVRGSHDASVKSGACRSRVRVHVRSSRTLNYPRSGDRPGSFSPIRLRPVK